MKVRPKEKTLLTSDDEAVIIGLHPNQRWRLVQKSNLYVLSRKNIILCLEKK